MSQAVKRACDACHRRKVKCDGINPCKNCAGSQLSCTYNAIPQKKGPKGSRAKVISELRETQRQTSLSAKVQSRMNGIPCPPNASLAPTPGLLSGELVKDCVSFFFENMYTQLPILDRRQVEQQILYSMEQNRDAYCLLTSLCAFVMLQPGMSMPPGDPFNLDMMPGANIVSSQLLVEETLRVRKGFEYLDSITLNAIATDFFLYACHYGQEMHDRAWYYLREATTMVHMVGMHKEDHYMQFDAVEASRRRRLFWLLYVTERAYAIQRNRPLTLHATINLPTTRDDPTDPLAHQVNSFVLLASLFEPFDEAFTATWNKTRGNPSSQYISGLTKQLGDLVQSYLCQDSNLMDLHTNQQWLKSTVWQLKNNGGNDSMSFQYGNMSRDLLVNMASQFPQGMELLNSKLIENLMELAHSTTEYLATQPPSRDPFALGPREHMNQVLSIVAMSRNGDHRFFPLLLHKLTEILPRQTNPMLAHAPENTNLATMDIFDGFGNAGMAQVPDFERKVSYEEYDKNYDMMNGSTPESAPSVAAQAEGFVGSPGMMSEYQPTMNSSFCAPMGDVVMSPLGHQNAMQQHIPQQMNQQQHIPSQQHMPPQQQMNQHDTLTHLGLRQGLPSHPMHSMRQPNFQLQPPPAHFHTRGMGNMNADIDFGALR